MSKIIIQNKKNRTVIVNTLTYPETVNNRINSAIASGIIEGCLPAAVTEKRKETLLECTAENLLSLEQRFCGAVTKQTFLDAVRKTVKIIIGCEKNGMDPNNFDLKPDRVFIEPVSGDIKCVYWAVINNQLSFSPAEFFKNLPRCLNTDSLDDSSFLEQYNGLFSEGVPFSLRAFERAVTSLFEGKALEPAGVVSSKANYSSTTVWGLEKDSDKNTGDNGGSISSNTITDLYAGTDSRELSNPEDLTVCPSCGSHNLTGSNFCIVCGSRMNQAFPASQPPSVEYSSGRESVNVFKGENQAPYPLSGTSLNTGNVKKSKTGFTDELNGTAVVGCEDTEGRFIPALTRTKNGEKTVINKPVFKIGTSRESCDMVITDNRYISRIHAYVMTRDDRYFIIDRNSTNKTYVDGKAIPTETEVELFDNTPVKLANEDMVFNIEQAENV